MLTRIALSLCVVTFACLEGAARDNGQFAGAAPHIREWFNSLRVPTTHAPCCGEADGHRTRYEVRDNIYWVPIEGVWYAIPPDTVIRSRGNPIGEGVVFYRMIGDSEGGEHRPAIICFVPNDVS
jgi:hypothetical protein